MWKGGVSWAGKWDGQLRKLNGGVWKGGDL